MPFDIARWLPEFPVRNQCLYLNHAGVAPLPFRVAKAMHDHIAEQQAFGAKHWENWRQTELSVRALAGQLVGARPKDVSIVRSTSEGISIVARGLRLHKGDAVLVGSEDFAANVAPYLALAPAGVVVKRFPMPMGRVEVDAIAPLLKPPAKVLALSWVAFHTGHVAPVAELARLAHERKIVVVLDAIQGLGVLPETMESLGVDALVADGHKWLLAPEGAGLLVTTEDLRAELEPVLAGWRNVRRKPAEFFLHDLDFYSDGRRFEPGSLPSVLVAGLAAALDLLIEVGVENVFERVAGHSRFLTQMLLEIGWHVVSPGSAHPIAGITAAQHPFLPAEEVVRRLRERQIEAAAREGFVRFSPHFYTTAGEIEALRVILGKI